MNELRHFLQPLRKSLFLRPASPESRRVRRLAAMRQAAYRLRQTWAPLPAPALARIPRMPAPHGS